MNGLLLAIKNALTTAVESLSGRIVTGGVPPTVSLAQGPYCVVSFVSDTPQFGFDDLVGVDTVQIQFAVFAEKLGDAEDVKNQINSALHGVALTVNGEQVKGTRRQTGFLGLPPGELPAGVRRGFQSFVVVEWDLSLS